MKKYFFIIFLLFSNNSFAQTKKTIFAGGCFWCMEQPFDEIEGVISTVSGYSGGDYINPSYEDVIKKKTGHLEVVAITYNSNKVSYSDLLKIFWKNVDPFDDKGQFCDKGPQYLSAIFYKNDQEKKIAQNFKKKLEKKFNKKIATTIRKEKIFYPSETYHQNYYLKNPVRYKFYRYNCGRDYRLKQVWNK